MIEKAPKARFNTWRTNVDAVVVNGMKMNVEKVEVFFTSDSLEILSIFSSTTGITISSFEEVQKLIDFARSKRNDR